jgi:aromatic ring-opening dioxygenase LigB subunit
MVKIAAGMASSHAYTFIDPHHWEERREVTRERYRKRYGEYPAVQPQIEGETLEGNLARYQDIRDGLDRLKRNFDTLCPDTLVLIADDQDENYREDNLPQIAIYTGERAVAVDSETARTIEVQSDAALATLILNEAVDAGFDLASSKSFPDDRVRSHAHAQILSFLEPRVPVVLIFLNAIHVPAPSPSRCYQFGQCLRGILDALPDERRVVLYASGGMSHFTAGYPWAHYQGPFGLGSISEDFDRMAIAAMREGRASELVASLSSRDLLANGAIEFRQWITLLGALDGAAPEWLAYQPFYRAVMAMGVAYWSQN